MIWKGPLYFFSSCTLAPAECQYSQLDKEALAIVIGVKRYHQYLHGHHFVIISDHMPLMHVKSFSHHGLGSNSTLGYHLECIYIHHQLQEQGGACKCRYYISWLSLPTPCQKFPTIYRNGSPHGTSSIHPSVSTTNQKVNWSRSCFVQG